MATKNKRNVSVKRLFIKIANAVMNNCCKQFGYTNKPILKESKLPNRAVCAFYARESKKHRYKIYYNYNEILNFYGEIEYLVEFVYFIAYIIAHECRHYYQYRQIYAKYPKELTETIADWKYNFDHYGECNESNRPLKQDAAEFSRNFMENIIGIKGFKDAERLVDAYV